MQSELLKLLQFMKMESKLTFKKFAPNISAAVLSKVYEKELYTRLHAHFESKKFLAKINMTFRLAGIPNMRCLNSLAILLM